MLQNFLQRSLIIGLALIMSFFLVANFTKFARYTKDDITKLSQNLEEYPKEQVLGVNTQQDLESTKDIEKYGCPKYKPIIGWIDFRGRKLIKHTLPNKQMASACFESLEQARQAGFEYESDLE